MTVRSGAGQLVQVGDAAAAGAAAGRSAGALGAEVGEAVLDVVGDPVGHDRAQRRDADRTAEGAEEGDDGAGRAEVLGCDLVLRGTAPGSASSCRCRDPCSAMKIADVPVRRCRTGWCPAGRGPPSPARRRLTSQAFQRPVVVMTWPETVEETNRPPIIGIVMTPDIVGRLVARQLEVLAEEDGAGEHRDTDEQRGQRGQRDGAVAEQPQRDDRLAGPGLDEHEEQRRARPRRRPSRTSARRSSRTCRRRRSPRPAAARPRR